MRLIDHTHSQLHTVFSRRDEHEEVFDVRPDRRLTVITEMIFDLRQQLRLISLDDQPVSERISALRATLHQLLIETREAGFEAPMAAQC